MGAMPESIIERISKIRKEVQENVETNMRKPMTMSSILFIQALSGGTLRIDNRYTNSPAVCKKLEKIEEDLKKTGNVIFSRSKRAGNLLIGDLVDVDLYSSFSSPIRATLLRNIDLLIIPDRKIYRYMKETQLKSGTVCQKLLELDSDDVVDAVFKINTFKTHSEVIPTEIHCTEDLVKLTEGEDFILLLNDDLAFMAAAADDEKGSREFEFYLIGCGNDEEDRIKRQDDYSILSLYISTPELYDEQS